MAVIAVRMKETHEAIGFFWAEGLRDTYWLIDECVDPAQCEYAVLRRGGVFWQGTAPNTAWPVQSVDDEVSMNGLSFCDSTNSVFLDKLDWKPFPADRLAKNTGSKVRPGSYTRHQRALAR